MLGLKKIRNGFMEIVKEHPVSVISVLISTILYCFICEGGSDNTTLTVKCLATFFLIIALGALPLEAFRMYRIKNGDKDILKNMNYKIACSVVMFVSVILGFFTAIFFSFGHNIIAAKIGVSELTVDLWEEYDYRIVSCFAVVMICAALYLFLKKSGCTFEEYTAKAFCGLMKAEIVFIVLVIGLMMIIGAFSVLIVEVDFVVYERVWILLLGFVQYPCALMGVSKTDDEISKFGKVMLNYVLTGLLAIAFVIIYAYIIKVIVKWMFPLHMVFGILTTLFGFGVFIWTMAQGVCEENLRKIFKYMPLLFIPCIIMEILSLGRQISLYGLTLTRYAGIAAIVFEIAYFVLYIYNMKKEKNAMPLVFCIIIAVSYIALLAPGINAYSVVIASHKGNVMKFLNENNSKVSKHAASESYKTIAYSCGAVGKNYIHKKLTNEENEAMVEISGSGVEPSTNSLYIYANRYEDNSYDISGGYKKLYVANLEYYGYAGEETDGYEYDVTCGGKKIGVVNLEDVIKKLIELNKAGASGSEMNDAIKEPVPLNDGGKFIISYISINCSEDMSSIGSIDANGYVLK